MVNVGSDTVRSERANRRIVLWLDGSYDRLSPNSSRSFWSNSADWTFWSFGVAVEEDNVIKDCSFNARFLLVRGCLSLNGFFRVFKLSPHSIVIGYFCQVQLIITVGFVR